MASSAVSFLNTSPRCRRYRQLLCELTSQSPSGRDLAGIRLRSEWCSTVTDLIKFAIAIQTGLLVKPETREAMFRPARLTNGKQGPIRIRLIADGVAFERAYCQAPICTPTRAAFLTGRYPFATGVLGNGMEFFPSDEKLITRTLADVGYDCALVGKLHLSAIRERLGDGTQ